MLLYNMFYRHHGVRRWSDLAGPRISELAELGLPRSAVLHYLPLDEIEKGPMPDDPIFSKVERNIFVGHATDLRNKEGNPRSNRILPDSEIRRFYRQHREFRRLIKLESALRDARTLVVQNYALLQHLYRYIPSAFSRYYRWRNIQATVWSHVVEMVEVSPDHQHFLRVILPERLPTLSQLRRAEGEITRSTIEPFKTDGEMTILDLWTWLGEQRDKSTMAILPAALLDKINLVFYDSGRWFTLNLGLINSWRAATPEEIGDEEDETAGKAPFSVQKYFLRALMSLMETRTLSGLTDQTSLDVDADTDEKSAETATGTGKGGSDTDVDPLKELEEVFSFDAALIQEDDIETGELIEGDIPLDTKPTKKSKAPNMPEVVTPASLDTDDLLEDEARLTADLDRLDALAAKQQSSREIDYRSAQALTYDPSPEERLKEEIDTLADSGLLSGAEYRRLEKLTGRYKTIPNPLGKGTLADLATVKPELVKIKESAKLVELDTVLDKSMLQSTLAEFDRKYISEVLPKDVAAAVVNIQKAGVAVTDYEVEEVQDAVNHYHSYAVKVVPMSGSPSTIRFRLPVVQEDGTYFANGVRYRTRKQRGDLPIRKVAPNRVALTSYYGKLFVERAERGTFNYDRWLTNRIVALGTDEASTAITDLRLTNSFDHLLELPRVYTALAKRLRAFRAGEYEFYIDYHGREKFFGAEAVKEAERKGLVIIARRGKDPVVVDTDNTFYLHVKGKLEVLGKITDVIGPELGQPPLEMAEIKLFSKNLPIGLALGYLLGLDRLAAQLKISPRRVPTGERLALEDHEYAIRFADESWVLSRDNQLATLIFAGFTRFRDVRDYSTREYNNKDVYVNILENNGVQLRYMRELDLLEKLFVDPITKELLVELKEPTNFIGLLFRATELLLTDWHPLENDLAYQRIKGYERFAGVVYGELVRGLRTYALRPKSRSVAVDVNPHAVWQTILQDPAQMLVEETSPLHNLREKEALTFTGVGGRTPRSMVARTRVYNERDMGVVSESTPDTGDVAVHTFLTPDAKFTSLRGITTAYDPKNDGAGRLLSSSALLAPASDRDDPRRVNISSFMR